MTPAYACKRCEDAGWVCEEHPRNPNLLFAGTEIGLFFSPNGGTNWIELKNNMPTLPFNDLVIHARRRVSAHQVAHVELRELIVGEIERLQAVGA